MFEMMILVSEVSIIPTDNRNQLQPIVLKIGQITRMAVILVQL